MPEPGLAKVLGINRERAKRAKELRNEGRKIIGYFCCYTPLEILTAANVVPYRIMGNVREPTDQADVYIEDIMCPFALSCFDIALKGSYDFCDGFIAPHSCDNIVKLYDIWRLNLKPSYSHFLNVPHTLSRSSFEFFEAEIDTFHKSIETFVQNKISAQQLATAINLHNQSRSMVRELYELRKKDPPLISGVETMNTLRAVMSLPVEEGNELLMHVIEEIKEREIGLERKGVRLLVWGPQLDDPTFIELVEQSGANVVMDDLCIGSRPFWHDVEVTDNPLKAISARYLEKITCPRTFNSRPATHEEDLENRFGHIRNYVKEYHIDGVIIYIIRFCDIFGFDAPDMEAYLKGIGLPVLTIEHEYSVMSLARLKTRIDAFIEMIS